MRMNVSTKGNAIVVAFLIVLSSSVVLSSVAKASSSSVRTTTTSVVSQRENAVIPARGILDSYTADPVAMNKVSAGLKDLLRVDPREQTRVTIYTSDPTALGRTLRAYGVNTNIGTVPSHWQGIRPVVVDLPAMVISKIAYLDSVYAVTSYNVPVPPQSPDPEVTDRPEPASGGAPVAEPNTIRATTGHHATEAWAAGYTGDGVRVAIMDSGVDFAHPDLLDTWAIIEDVASPYYLWPIAFDPNSMFAYLVAGQVFPNANSWYVDTSFNETADVNSLLPTFNGMQYNVSGIPSASGWYHMGIHPSPTLWSRFAGTSPGILVTDSVTAYVYDTIYVDLNNNGMFGDDKPTDITDPISYADYRDATSGLYDDTSGWDWGDGMPDVSGGLLYFIADGKNPLPYSDVVADRYGLPTPMPLSGDLIALMIGDQAVAGGDHGTMCASAVAAQNQTGVVQGFAPDAKIIAVGDIYYGGFGADIYNFAAEGYDGMPDTGDEAMIASSSYGSSDVDNDGWDYEARWVSLLTSFYPNTAFAASTGNGGYGFGTVNSPGGSSAEIAVGASTSYYNGPGTSWETGTTWNFGDVQPWSDRGPTSLGNVAPHVVTVGAWASGDNAINRRTVGATNGTASWSIWGGTSLSCPATAGILAVIYDAYDQGHGAYPTNDVARELLMNGADNIHYDPLVAGAGLSNTYRSALMAAMQDGVTISPSFWTPGNFRGTSYPGFAHVVPQGGSSSMTFQLTNQNPGSAATSNIADGFLKKTGEWKVDFWSNNSEESVPASSNRPDYLWNASAIVPPGTQLVRAIVYTNYSSFDDGFDYNPDSYYRALFYNWKDLNTNGIYWNDLNGNGVVNTGELDANEYMRFTYAYGVANVQNAFVHDPFSRVADGLLFGVIHRIRGLAVPSTLVHAVLEFYNTVDEPWITLDKSSVVLSAGGGTGTVTATVNVPPNAAVGVYSAMITVTTGGVDTVIPVVINVAGNSENIAMQEDTSNTHYYDNGKIYGGQDWSWRAESGDWRFYFTDIPDSTPITAGTRFMVHTQWANYPTDIDTVILGPTPDDFSNTLPSEYGPYTLAPVGGSPNTNVGGGLWLFDTATGGPEEWVSAPAKKGLHEVLLHNVLYAGEGPYESFTGTTGLVNVNPFPWTEQVSLNTGTKSFDFTSTMDLPSGMDVKAYGVSQPVTYNSPIAQGEQVNFWVNASNAGLMDVILTSGFPVDIDLYVYYEDPVFGEIGVGSSTSPTANERVTLNLPANGQYRIEVDGFSVPMPGVTFDLTVDLRQGLNLVPANVPVGPITHDVTYTFDIQYTLPDVEGDYYGVVFIGPMGAATAIQMPVLLMARDITPPAIDLHSPAAGGAYKTSNVPIIHASFDNVRGAFYSGVDMDSIHLTVDGRDVTASTKILPGHLWWNLTFLLSEGPHTGEIQMKDLAMTPNLASNTFVFTVDNTAPLIVLTSPAGSLTNQPIISVTGYTESSVPTVYINGAPYTTIGGAFTGQVTLVEGPNTITVEATDPVGNTGFLYKDITLDTIAPPLAVTQPTSGQTLKDRSVVVIGTTERGATVYVRGINAALDNAGGFSIMVPLTEGANSIEVMAKDAAGNTAVSIIGINVDTVPPMLVVTSPSAFSNSRTVTVAGQTEIGAAVTVNGNVVSVAGDGTFTTNVNYASDGTKNIWVNATDVPGNVATVIKTVVVDTVPPTINLALPTLLFQTDIPSVEVMGTTEPGATVTVMGQVADVSASGDFDLIVPLVKAGVNTITVTATDQAGNAATVTRDVTYNAPDIAGLQNQINNLQLQIQNLLALINTLNNSIVQLTNQINQQNITQNTQIQNLLNNVTTLTNLLTQTNQNLGQAQNDIKTLRSDVNGLSNVVLMGLVLLIVMLFVGLIGLYFALTRKIGAAKGPQEDLGEVEEEEELPEPKEEVKQEKKKETGKEEEFEDEEEL